MCATIRISPVAWSCAIAVTRPLPFEKSSAARGSIGRRNLPAAQSPRQTLDESRELVEGGTARVHGLACAGRSFAHQHAASPQLVDRALEGRLVRHLARSHLAEQLGARERFD